MTNRIHELYTLDDSERVFFTETIRNPILNRHLLRHRTARSALEILSRVSTRTDNRGILSTKGEGIYGSNNVMFRTAHIYRGIPIQMTLPEILTYAMLNESIDSNRIVNAILPKSLQPEIRYTIAQLSNILLSGQMKRTEISGIPRLKFEGINKTLQSIQDKAEPKFSERMCVAFIEWGFGMLGGRDITLPGLVKVSLDGYPTAFALQEDIDSGRNEFATAYVDNITIPQWRKAISQI